MSFGRRLGIALLLAPMLFGCAASPWSASVDKPEPLASATEPKAIAAAEPKAASSSTESAPATHRQAMQEVLAELKQLGEMDPQSQQKLLEDLQQTDPAFWPLVLQQFRAALAYRKKYVQPTTTTVADKPPAPAPRPAPFLGKIPPPALRESHVPAARPTPQSTPLVVYQPLSPLSAPHLLPTSPAASETLCLAAGEQTIASPPFSLPPPLGGEASSSEPASVQRASYEGPLPAGSNSAGIAERSPQERDSAAPEAPWRDELTGTIQRLEAQISSAPKTAGDFASHARLRMLYALAGRREEAARPIPAAPAAMQDFWAKELFGLSLLWDQGQAPDVARRAAECKLHLSDALARLGESAPLVVRNLAFCTAVQSYGCYTSFKKCEFTPRQEVLLYAEVENFTSHSTPKGFHTELQSSYQIFDTGGQRMADHVFTTTEEYCQNHRRDFFIGYHLRLPSQIPPGAYTLQLTIEDRNSRKVGQAALKFTIKNTEK